MNKEIPITSNHNEGGYEITGKYLDALNAILYSDNQKECVHIYGFRDGGCYEGYYPEFDLEKELNDIDDYIFNYCPLCGRKIEVTSKELGS